MKRVTKNNLIKELEKRVKQYTYLYGFEPGDIADISGMDANRLIELGKFVALVDQLDQVRDNSFIDGPIY